MVRYRRAYQNTNARTIREERINVEVNLSIEADVNMVAVNDELVEYQCPSAPNPCAVINLRIYGVKSL